MRNLRVPGTRKRMPMQGSPSSQVFVGNWPIPFYPSSRTKSRPVIRGKPLPQSQQSGQFNQVARQTAQCPLAIPDEFR